MLRPGQRGRAEIWALDRTVESSLVYPDQTMLRFLRPVRRVEAVRFRGETGVVAGPVYHGHRVQHLPVHATATSGPGPPRLEKWQAMRRVVDRAGGWERRSEILMPCFPQDGSSLRIAPYGGKWTGRTRRRRRSLLQPGGKSFSASDHLLLSIYNSDTYTLVFFSPSRP